MTRRFLESLAERCDERLPPIVSKELRQAARGRFLSGIVLTLVLVQSGTLAFFLVDHKLDVNSLLAFGGAGKGVFSTLVSFLMVLSTLCLPIYAAVRFFIERRGDGLSLMFISTLSPWKIIVGKILSNGLLGLLMMCLCLPYLAFTYFLRGIDLSTIGEVFLVVAVSCGVAVVFAIFLAAIPAERLMLVLLAAGGFILLLWWFFLVLILLLTGIDRGDVSASIGELADGWLMLLVILLFVGLLVYLAVALISPKVSNRAKPVRLYLTTTWLVLGAAALWVSRTSADYGFLEIWFIGAVLCFGGALLVATSAPDRLSGRVREALPRQRWRRLAAFPLSSGSAAGFAWAVGGAAITVACMRYGVSEGWVDSDLVDFGNAFVAYLAAYGLLAVALQRGVLAQRVARERTWTLALSAITLGCLLPPLVLMLASFGQDSLGFEDGYGLLLNPLAGAHDVIGGVVHVGATLVALILFYVKYTWFRDQFLEFWRSPATSTETTTTTEDHGGPAD